MKDIEKEVATCRYCAKKLKGDSYMYGGSAYHPKTKERCPTNYYGGFVCSKYCDIQATLQQESSFPGAGIARTPSQMASKKIKSNWDI